MILTHRLFRGAGAGAASSDSPAAARTSADGFDPVAGEMERWANLPHDHFSEFFDDDGLLNEFQMMWALRERFPLHFIVFKQTASHLGHEANVEQVFPPSRWIAVRSEHRSGVSFADGDALSQQEMVQAPHERHQG